MGRYKCWIHCLDCGELELVPRYWLDRKRFRCRSCGGYVEPSEAMENELTTARDESGSPRKVNPDGHDRSGFVRKK